LLLTSEARLAPHRQRQQNGWQTANERVYLKALADGRRIKRTASWYAAGLLRGISATWPVRMAMGPTHTKGDTNDGELDR
jgi:hypothetical protein